MAITDIFGVADKLLGRFLPKRGEALRNRIDKLEKERDAILAKPSNKRNVDKLDRILVKLSRAKKALQNRA